MRLLARARTVWRSIFRPAQVERELDDELRFALEELAMRHQARGLPAEAAARAARLELGRVDRIKEDVHAQSPARVLDAGARDVSHAWRNLARTPGFSLVVVLILAGGIGAAAAIFSIVNTLLLTPLPYRDANRLVFVWQDLTSAGYPRAPLAGPELQDLRQRSRLFTGFGAIWANTVALTDGREPEQLRIGLVTPDFFDVLGADALLGRTFKAGDDGPDSQPAILLSHELWRRRYGADPALVGQRIHVNGRPTTVLGVMPASFSLLLPPDSAIPDDQQAWLPLGRNSLRGPRTQQFMRVVGRMAPGARLADAQQEISAIGRQVGGEFSDYRPDGLTLYGVGLQAEATREVRPALLALLAAVCLLLTIGCVNVAGLLVTRAAARQHEVAVRLAIGASRALLFRQCLIEGLLIALAGGLAGALLARGMLALLISARPDSLGRIDATQIDLRVLGFAIAVSMVWGALFSIAPFAQIRRTNAPGVLQGGGWNRTTGQGYRVRAALVVAQVAIGSVLLITAALLARGFYELQHVRLGFSDPDVLTFKVSLSGTRYRSRDAFIAFSQQLRQRLMAIPGVAAAGATSHLPYDTVPNWGTVYLREQETDPSRAGLADARSVTPGYFESIGAGLAEGRWLTDADAAGALPVAMIDDTLAARLWPGESAIGKRLKADPGTTGSPRVVVTIVGVVRHLRHREVTRDLREQMYFPWPQSFRNPMAYAVLAPGRAADLAPAIRAAMQEIDRTLPIYDVRPLTAYTDSARATRRFTLLIAATFAGSALVLATVGIYSVTAFASSQRRREFGVRVALGARADQIAALVLKSGWLLAGKGAVAGCVIALATARLIQTQLYGVAFWDPASYLAGAGAVLLGATIATAVPAFRAARTNIVRTLID